jgi:hypothetical protein
MLIRDLVSRSQASDGGANAAKSALIVALMVLAIVTVALSVWANLASIAAPAVTLWR